MVAPHDNINSATPNMKLKKKILGTNDLAFLLACMSLFVIVMTVFQARNVSGLHKDDVVGVSKTFAEFPKRRILYVHVGKTGGKHTLVTTL